MKGKHKMFCNNCGTKKRLIYISKKKSYLCTECYKKSKLTGGD